MPLLAVIGQFDIHPEDASAASELMRLVMNETIKEQGCHHYAYSHDLSTPNRFQLSELWEDDASLAAHLSTDHVAAYRTGMRKLRVEKRTVRRYDIAAVKDL